ncbi:MAG: hypothetical protein MSS16_10780 [Streptococcus orisratti]|uniref:hypothetical protein n=1 Tax=Streptococcus TaxID=1301 RepID=UPI00040ED0B0|nr:MULTISPECIES: hypothetical protein [Streptococcus]MCI7678535.1 hypothetical protein [Streptococcus orisratti]
MKMKKLFSLLMLGLALILLAACSQKSAEDIVKTELKDSYTGYSELSGYDSLIFTGGGQELEFDKKNHKLKSGDEEVYYEVVAEDKLPKSMKGIMASHEAELKDKHYFIINVGYHKDDIWGKVGDQLYGVVLTEGGKSINIFEFETGYTNDGYFNFTGEAK